MKLSILIPVYNEAATAGEMLQRVLAVSLPGIEREIIIVDDGSTDRTAERIQHASLGFERLVQVYTLPRHAGKGAAIRAGLAHVSGDVVLIQDADLEYDPANYEALLEPILSGRASVVYGSRFLNPANRIPWRSRLARVILTPLANLLYGTRLTDEATAYKVFTTAVLKGVDLECTGFEFCPEVTAKVSKHGYQIVEVPIAYQPRTKASGKKVRHVRDGLIAIYTLLKYRLLD